jgi:hypothetical protein
MIVTQIVNQQTKLFMNEKLITRTAATGLLIGCVLGMTGTFVPSDIVRNVLWAVDSCGLILAAALLTLYFFKKGNDIVAAGFLIFTIAESIIFSSCAVTLNESIPAFGTGACLWALSMAVISSQKLFPLFVRSTGFITAVLFSIVAFLIFSGREVNALAKPLPFFAYPFFAATLVGWALALLFRKHNL